MEKPNNYDETQVIGDFEFLEPGGYICKIKDAKEETSSTGKAMLVVAFDIAEGEHEGIYQRRFEEISKNDIKAKWPNNGVHRIMLENSEGNTNKFFKTFITSVEQSNNFTFWKNNKGDVKNLKDKLFGGIFGEEEYEKMNGEIGTTTKLVWIRTTATIEDGKYTIPEPKKLIRNNSNDSNDIFNQAITSDDDLPF